MTAPDRRQAIQRLLTRAPGPLSATALAKELGVSRQIIVGDVALLRAAGTDVISTPRGYLLPKADRGVTAVVACRHTSDELERELNLVVDQGCTCVDVSVEHPIYGVLTGRLEVSSRFDVQEFLRAVAEQSAAPLSLLTGGVHLHRLRAPDQATLDRTRAALRSAGFLLE